MLPVDPFGCVERGIGWLVSGERPSQVPAIILGMLGIDERYQGMGLGAQLLRDAILNSLKVSELAGARALVVDQTGEAASAFYHRFGFSDLPGTTRMVLRLI